MKCLKKKITDVFLRYAIMLLLSVSGLWIFYAIFTPLTIYPTYFLLDLFFGATLSGNIILVKNMFPIEIVEACVAGSAYYLLLILNLSTPNIVLKKRLKIVLESFLALLIINLLRIFFLSIMYVSGSTLFDVTHKIFWYFANILFILCIWFFMVKSFKLKEIPFYSDLKFFFNLQKKANKSKHTKKNK
ncbi:pacearchaeosortase [Candidatus Pacearchaeota archaeon]|nr:pacearchaeosortase [Candidatus Pacearchaeota archaeon]